MPQTILRHGEPLSCDYTPGGAVTAGDVIVLERRVIIARHDIAAGIKGSADVDGGVYECVGDAAITAGKKVYWVNASNKVSEDDNGGANKPFGYVAPGSSCAGDGLAVDVVHDPSA